MWGSECTLVSASCTTGWTDWIHGELWICPDGLFRRPLGLRATIGHASGPTVDPVARITRSLSPADLAQGQARRHRHVWVAWDTIAQAELRHGFLTDSLHFRLRDGRRGKFLWLAVDRADVPLADALSREIGDRLEARRRTRWDALSGRTDGAGSDTEEDWPVTINAAWVDHGIDVLELHSAIVALAATGWVIGAQWFIAGRPDPRVVLIAVLAAGWIIWQGIRRRPVSLKLDLTSTAARIHQTSRSGQATTGMARDRAGWLTAAESGIDLHDRRLVLTDDGGREVAQLRARPARIEVHADSAEGEAWLRMNLPYLSSERTAITSVTALLGTWWPHPDRRVSVRGNMNVRRPWVEPALADYPAWEMRERRRYAALFAMFPLFFVVMVAFIPTPLEDRVAILPVAVALLALAVRSLLR